MDPFKKKDPMDIFAGTSAQMGTGPYSNTPAPVSKPKLTRPSFETTTRQANGVQFKPGADIRRPDGRLKIVGPEAPAMTLVRARLAEAKKANTPAVYDPNVRLEMTNEKWRQDGGIYSEAYKRQNNPQYQAEQKLAATPGVVALTTKPVVPVAAPAAVSNVPTAADANAKLPVIENTSFKDRNGASRVLPSGLTATTDADGKQVISGTGTAPQANALSVTAPVLPTAPALTRDPQALADNAVNSQLRASRFTRGDAQQIINPMSADGEILRRIEIASGGSKGSPSSRRAIMGALAGQLDAGNQASAQFQRGADAAVQEGLQGAIQGEQTQQLTRGQLLAQSVQQQGQERLARLQRPPTVLADGTMAQVEGTSAQQVVGVDGQPVKAPMAKTAAEGQITPALKYKTLSDDIARISEDVTLDSASKAAAIAPLQAERAALEGGAPQASNTPNLDAFIAAAKSQNSKMTDQQLAEAFKAKYGK